jgi:hypothetical protein
MNTVPGAFTWSARVVQAMTPISWRGRPLCD